MGKHDTYLGLKNIDERDSSGMGTCNLELIMHKTHMKVLTLTRKIH